MHWLPLVAMVIASALLFPLSPVPSLVAATTEPGKDSSTTSVVEDHSSETSPENIRTLVIDSKPYGGQEDTRSAPVQIPTQIEGLTEPPPAGVEEVGGQSGRRGAAVSSLDMDMEEDMLLLGSHPRVFFSTSSTPPKHPPPHLLQEEEEEEVLEVQEKEGELEAEEEWRRESDSFEETHPKDTASPGQDREGETYRNLLLGLSQPRPVAQVPHRTARRKRDIRTTPLERSVCESNSYWVTDRRTAIDHEKQNVTVLKAFPVKGAMRWQSFYETTCRGPDHRGARGEQGVAGAGCLGVDKKHWLSECQTKQSYVMAFTVDKNGVEKWRWILINSSCVCVLKSRLHRSRGHWTG